MSGKNQVRKLFQSWMLAVSMGFVFLADISASTATGFFWYEPDCPEELLK